ncbi:hypothetical protein [Pseudoalteromonas sp. S16_S37]|uniref:hypothetical protein n=1 Tax=Pseudoalteromonas sp. S16_S37 TaxID=2720228 RepID=UPI0016808BD9|nr:hypothetical protein [Pseudoalteromonas sp. S16_S37]MBD1581084.1 hypothetical protein [Pseudoalteromonas sp. S16_S37]
MSNVNATDSIKYPLIILVIFAIVAVLGVYILWNIGLGVGFGGTTETWAHFGSFFGGVSSPTLSFFSFIGVLYAIYLQSKSNTEQAKANKQAAEAMELSTENNANNLVEQRKLQEQEMQHDKQQHLLAFFVDMFNELDRAGCEALNDFFPKEIDQEPIIGPYSNTFRWKVKSTAVATNKLKDKLDEDSAELVVLLIAKGVGQINTVKQNLELYRDIFSNTDDVIFAIEELNIAERAFTQTKTDLIQKYKFSDI